jgi:hypothetical protein
MGRAIIRCNAGAGNRQSNQETSVVNLSSKVQCLEYIPYSERRRRAAEMDIFIT